MKKPVYLVIFAVLCLVAVFLCREGWYVSFEVWRHIGRYAWMAAGVAAGVVLARLKFKNLEWLKTFSHELTHALTGMFLLRRIVSLRADERQGAVRYTSGKTDFIVSLAPYCIPVFTLLALLVWSLVASKSAVASGSLAALDVLVGFTAGFHAVCFAEQTGKHQTDINQLPAWFAYTYIWTFRLLNLLVLLLCYLPWRDTGEPLKLWGAFWYLLKQAWLLVAGMF